MLVFQIPSKSLKNEIVVKVGECFGASSDAKTFAKSLADFPNTPRDPIKSDFFEQIWKYLSIQLSSGAGL